MDQILENLLAELTADIPAELYHYTTAAGFEAITRSGIIRATNIRFLNDRRELTHARDLLERILRSDERRLLLVSDDGQLRTAKKLVDDAEALADGLGRLFDDGQIWVSCFSAAGDDLAQWRAYGGVGDRYCIGLDSAAFRALTPACVPSTDALIGLFRVTYRPALHRRYLGKLATFAIQHLHDPEYPLPRIIRTLQSFAALMKDPAFAAEREWRYVVSTDDTPDGVNIAERSGYLRPFIQIAADGRECGLLPMTSVTVLPGSDASRSLLATRLMLRATGYRDGIDVRLSSVPFVTT